MSKFVFCLVGFVLFQTTSVSTLKITNFYVPSTVVLDKKVSEANKINLICAYRYIRYERGFVLKWYFNHDLIYIWSPGSSEFGVPQIFGRFVGHVNVENSVNGTLQLLNITPDLSGTYQCIAMTYEALVRRESHLQVVIPEDDFFLERIVSPRFVEYRCAINNIFPSPHMKIRWNSTVLFSVTKYALQGENELFDVSESIYTSNRRALQANVSCELSIVNTDYRKELVFDEEESNTIEVS